MTNSSFTVSWRDIAKKLNPLYEDQGYAPPSDVQMQNAVLKAASVLNAKREKVPIIIITSLLSWIMLLSIFLRIQVLNFIKAISMKRETSQKD